MQSNPTPTRPTMELHRTAMDATCAEMALDKIILTYPGKNLARNSYMTAQLNHQFKVHFGMNDEVARAAVAEEMNRRYAPNPWDAPGPRRPRPRTQRGPRVAEEEKAEERSEEKKVEEGSEKEKVEERSEGARKAEGYSVSEEQWDLFERKFVYK